MIPGIEQKLQNGLPESILLEEPVSLRDNEYSLMDEAFLMKVLQVIEKNMNETNFGAEELRKELFISRSHLHRKLKSLTNRSTTGLIRCIRLKKAAELLYQRVATVSEIAYDTGFNNLSYFTSCFKKEFGVVPSAYFRMYRSCPSDRIAERMMLNNRVT